MEKRKRKLIIGSSIALAVAALVCALCFIFASSQTDTLLKDFTTPNWEGVNLNENLGSGRVVNEGLPQKTEDIYTWEYDHSKYSVAEILSNAMKVLAKDSRELREKQSLASVAKAKELSLANNVEGSGNVRFASAPITLAADIAEPVPNENIDVYWKLDEQNSRLYIRNDNPDGSYSGFDSSTGVPPWFTDDNLQKLEALQYVSIENPVYPKKTVAWFGLISSEGDIDKLVHTSRIKSIDGLDNIKLDSCVDTTCMFAGCKEAAINYQPNWSNVQNTWATFAYSGATQSTITYFLNNPAYNTSSLAFFANYNDNIQQIYFTNSVYFPNCTNYEYMFARNANLDTVSGIQNFNIVYSPTTNADGDNTVLLDCMFLRCSKLQNIDDFDHFMPYNSTVKSSVYGMFAYSGLKAADVFTWNNGSTPKISTSSFLFYDCRNLKTILANDDTDWRSFDIPMSKMFYNCVSLVAWKGTVYDPSHIDGSDYGLTDGYSSNPGYYTSCWLDYLEFQGIEPKTTSSVAYTTVGSLKPDVKYSWDCRHWTQWNPDTYLTLDKNQSVWVKGNNPLGFSRQSDPSSPSDQSNQNFSSAAPSLAGSLGLSSSLGQAIGPDASSLYDQSGESDASDASGSNNYVRFVIHGLVLSDHNVTSLLDDFDGNSVDKIPNAYCFAKLFAGCEDLCQAPVLRPNELAANCYEGMFYKCRNLPKMPDLPAAKLAYSCYAHMFQKCSGLTNFNNENCLPASTLSDNCYQGMFEDCTSLESVPTNYLPAKKLERSCYQQMFRGCTSLETPPDLPAGTDLSVASGNSCLATYCYADMFSGCTSLESAPELPDHVVQYMSYYNMFYGCTSLHTIANMYAYALQDSACASMYEASGIQNIEGAVFLGDPDFTGGQKFVQFPGTSSCERMFANCKELTNVDNIIDDDFQVMYEDVGSKAFREMFAECTSLRSGFSKFIVGNSSDINSWAFARMYYGCTALESTPEKIQCSNNKSWWRRDGVMSSMFENCTALHEVNAFMTFEGSFSGVGYSAFQNMFKNCERIIQLPDTFFAVQNPSGNNTLYINTFAFAGMFEGCKSLTNAPAMFSNRAFHLTEDTGNNFMSMYKGCASLIDVPSYTFSIGYGCTWAFSYMFDGCKSLVQMPDFNEVEPASGLACDYSLDMNCGSTFAYTFNNCTSLLKPGRLPNLITNRGAGAGSYSGTYNSTFKNCYKLNVKYIRQSEYDADVDESFFDTSKPFCNLYGFGNEFPSTFLNTGGLCGVINGGTPTYDEVLDNISQLGYLVVPGVRDDEHYITFRSAEEYDNTPVSFSYISPEAYPDASPLQIYNEDNGSWVQLQAGTTIQITNRSQKILIKGSSQTSSMTGPIGQFNINDGKIAIEGDVQWLLDRGAQGMADHDYCFEGLFEDCTDLVSTPFMTSQTLSVGCYKDMYKGCTGLRTYKELPAENLTAECYQSMFEGCTSLKVANALIAEILPNDCYHSMFKDCSSLLKTSVMDAKSVGAYACCSMYENCTNLSGMGSTLPQFKNTQGEALTDYCYSRMFFGCSNLSVEQDGAGSKILLKTSSYDSTAVEDMFDGTSGIWSGDPLTGYNYTIGFCGLALRSGAGSSGNLWWETDLSIYDNNLPNIQYSLDGVTWHELLPWLKITYGANDTVYFKGNNSEGLKGHAHFAWDSSLNIYAYGNVMSLVTGDSGDNLDYDTYTLPSNCFQFLFNHSNLHSIPTMPAKHIGTYAYSYMFNACPLSSFMVNTPTFPWVSINPCGCERMFENSGYGWQYANLAFAYDLPKFPNLKSVYYGSMANMFAYSAVTNLNTFWIDKNANYSESGYSGTGAFESMFQGCQNIGALPNDFCYKFGGYNMCKNMFANSTVSKVGPIGVLSNDKCDSGSYYRMFYGCEYLKLDENSILHYDEEFYDNCCFEMFAYSYTENPLIFVDDQKPDQYGWLYSIVHEYAFAGMYSHCSHLTQPSDLKLASKYRHMSEGSFKEMYDYCTSLTTLPLDLLNNVWRNRNSWDDKYVCKSESMHSMFRGCSSLNNESIKSVSLCSGGYGGDTGDKYYIYGNNGFAEMFENCTGITELPDNFFPFDIRINRLESTSDCTSLCDCMFKNTRLTHIQAGIFKNGIYEIGPNWFHEMFSYCPSLTTVEGSLFKNTREVNYRGCASMFEGDQLLTKGPRVSAPIGGGQITVQNQAYDSMFKNCYALQVSKNTNGDVILGSGFQYSGGASESSVFNQMFANTGGTFTGTPTNVGNDLYILSSDFTFTAQEDGAKFSTDITGLEISTNGGSSYTDYTAGTEVSLTNTGDTAILRKKAATSLSSTDFSEDSKTPVDGPIGSFDIDTGRISVSGSIANLLLNTEKLGSSTFEGLFANCTDLVSAPSLSFIELGESCYKEMFKGCTSLTVAPPLPAETLAVSCYQSMFEGSGLIEAPYLHAKSLQSSCYEAIFKNCLSLVYSPTIDYAVGMNAPADAFKELFCGCSSLEIKKGTKYNLIFDSKELWDEQLSPFAPDMFKGTAGDADDTPKADGFYGMPYKGLSFSLAAGSSSNAVIKYQVHGSLPALTLMYSTNGGETWRQWSRNSTANITNLQNVCIKGQPSSGLSFDADNYVYFEITGGEVDANGNIFSLLDNTDGSSFDGNMRDYSFYKLFSGCELLKSVPDIPSATLSNNCYAHMFEGCSGLTTVDEDLLGSTVARQNSGAWYQSMFANCENLENAPKLPMTTSGPSCYESMFYHCESLNLNPDNDTVATPLLPAMNIYNSCYKSMFEGCSSLTYAPRLNATALDMSCYEAMFRGCSSLEEYENTLAAVSVPSYAYRYMFADCALLETTPALPATSLFDGSYYAMFAGCSSLTSATTLPSFTNVGSNVGSCAYMFAYCSSLNILEASTPSEPDKVILSNGRSATNDITYENMFINTGGYFQGSPSDDSKAYSWSEPALIITAQENGLQISNDISGLQYDDGNGYQAYSGETINLDEGDTVMFKVDPTASLSANELEEGTSIGYFSDNDKTYTCDGPIGALYNSADLTDSCFSGMFEDCTGLLTAPALPYMHLSESCYESMFKGCTSLTAAPSLPATELAANCYKSMFEGCTSIERCPELRAETLFADCYNSMFKGCQSLRTATKLAAKTLVSGCYSYMFYGCTSLDVRGETDSTSWHDYNMVLDKGIVTDGLTQAHNMFADWDPSAAYCYLYGNSDALTVSPTSQSVSVSFHNFNNAPNVMFSTNNGMTWSYVGPDTTYTVSPGNNIKIKGYNPNGFSTYINNYTTFRITSSAAVTLSGNVYSLIDNSDGYNSARGIPSDYCFYKLFENCSCITTTPNFVNCDSLTVGCYSHMFAGCTMLNTAQPIYSGVMAESCCENMFDSCRALNSAPELHSRRLAKNCFMKMFQGCETLGVAPDFDATVLAEGCYEAMFAGCTGLTKVPTLPAKTLVKNCYRAMFWGCTSLTNRATESVPGDFIKADTFAADSSGCCFGMFASCTNLEQAPDIAIANVEPGVTTLNINDAFNLMFQYCSKLEDVATMYNVSTSSVSTITADNIYASMYFGCNALENVTLNYYTMIGNGSFNSMFRGCANLVSVALDQNYDVANAVTKNSTFANMFNGCSKFTTLTSTDGLFSGTFDITTATIGVSTFESMFEGCSLLASSPFSFTGVTLKNNSMRNMFKSCSALCVDQVTGGSATSNIILKSWNVSTGLSAADCADGMFKSVNGSSPYRPDDGTPTLDNDYIWLAE